MIKQMKIVFISTLLPATLALGQPKLSLDKPVIDLGIIYSGMKKQGKLVLKNIGNDTLRIFSVRPSCGCTAVKQPKEFLLPNESDIIEIEFNSTGYLGKPDKYINIETNDPTSQYLSVKLTLDVKMVLEPVNHSIQMWFGNVGIGKISIQHINLMNVTAYPITIINISASSPAITLKLDKKIVKPNEIVDIEISVKPYKAEYINGNFSIETDSKEQPREELKVIFNGTKEN